VLVGDFKNMGKFILFLLFIGSLLMRCGDARAACYEGRNRVDSGSCEFFVSASYFNNNANIPPDVFARILLICLKQEQDRKTCDNRAEWWPLPKQLNHPSGNENILSTSPGKVNE
jgi:hypothetical protein